MNLLISLIYAPIIFYSIRNFDIQTVSITVCIFSLIWLILVFKKGIKEFIFPIIYLTISIFAYLSNELLLLKAIPFLISLLISSFMFYSFITNNSFIFILLKKINKEVSPKEKVYIQKSTLFWFFSSIINLLIHLYVLNLEDEKYWMIYSSIGWYFVFIFAGIIQFTHKKIYFKEDV